MDACDAIMIKTNQETGLVGYHSKESIENRTSFKWNIRIIAYMSVLVIMFGVIIYMFSQRGILDGSILRSQSTTFTKIDDHTIRNVFSYKLLNKSFEEASIWKCYNLQ